VELAPGFTDLRPEGIHVFHRKSGVFGQDDSFALSKPILVFNDNFLFAFLRYGQCLFTSFLNKIFAWYSYQAKTLHSRASGNSLVAEQSSPGQDIMLAGYKAGAPAVFGEVLLDFSE